MSTLRRRIVAGLGANTFGQCVNVAIQLLSLPLFLSQWDAVTYGVWLMLSAVPTYLAMADVGMVTAAGNRMTMAMGRDDRTEANRVFHSALMFMTLICAGVALVVFPLIAAAPQTWVFSADGRNALALMSATVLTMLFSGLADALFRATGRYATGVMLGNLLRLAEWAGSMVGLLLVGSFTAVAMGALLVRSVGLLLIVHLSRQGTHGLTWGRAHASLGEVRLMLKPALLFMVFPLSNALSFQGVTLVVGHLLGPASLAVFNTYRTLARTAVQVTGILSLSLWAEFARMYGAGAGPQLASLYRRSSIVGVVVSLALSAGLYLAAPSILRIWTHDAISFQSIPMLVLLAYAVAGGIWHVPRVLLLATNNHFALAKWYLVAAVASIGMVAATGAWGLVGVGSAILVVELAIAAFCLYLAQQMIYLPAARARKGD